MNEEKKSTVLFSAAGALAGYLSFLSGNILFAVLIAFAGLLLIKSGAQKVFRKDAKWILTNGGILYIFFWFVFWILFFNL